MFNVKETLRLFGNQIYFAEVSGTQRLYTTAGNLTIDADGKDIKILSDEGGTAAGLFLGSDHAAFGHKYVPYGIQDGLLLFTDAPSQHQVGLYVNTQPVVWSYDNTSGVTAFAPISNQPAVALSTKNPIWNSGVLNAVVAGGDGITLDKSLALHAQKIRINSALNYADNYELLTDKDSSLKLKLGYFQDTYPASTTITAVNLFTNTFSISGNFAAYFNAGDKFIVTTGVNAGTYIVSSAVNNLTDTDIVVTPSIPAVSTGEVVNFATSYKNDFWITTKTSELNGLLISDNRIIAWLTDVSSNGSTLTVDFNPESTQSNIEWSAFSIDGSSQYEFGTDLGGFHNFYTDNLVRLNINNLGKSTFYGDFELNGNVLGKYTVQPDTQPGWDDLTIPTKKYVDDAIVAGGLGWSSVLAIDNTSGANDVIIKSPQLFKGEDMSFPPSLDMNYNTNAIRLIASPTYGVTALFGDTTTYGIEFNTLDQNLGFASYHTYGGKATANSHIEQDASKFEIYWSLDGSPDNLYATTFNIQQGGASLERTETDNTLGLDLVQSLFFRGIGGSPEGVELKHAKTNLGIDYGATLIMQDSYSMLSAGEWNDGSRVYVVNSGGQLTSALEVLGYGLNPLLDKVVFRIVENSGTASAYMEALGALESSFAGIEYSAQFHANYSLRSLVDKEYVDLAISAAGGSVQIMSPDDKFINALTTVADGDPAVATGITNTPVDGCYVAVYINGQEVEVGNGVKTKTCYFSGDGGTNARGFSSSHPNGQVQAGDILYWNGSIINFELTAGWRVSYQYLTTV